MLVAQNDETQIRNDFTQIGLLKIMLIREIIFQSHQGVSNK